MPNVEGGADQAVCEGDSVTLFGSGAITYSWTGGIMDNVTFVATSIGITTYILVGTDVSGCKDSDTVDVTVNELPIISTETPVDVSACGLSDGSITIVVSGGTGAYTYSVDSGSTYVANGGVFTGLTDGSYSVFVDDGSCPIAGSDLVISSPAPPAPPTGGTDTTYCEGDTISDLYAAGTGGTLNWYSDSSLTTNIGSGDSLTPMGTIGTTTYYVAETIGACEGSAISIDVTITALPNVNGGGDQSVCEGDSVTLNGSGATSYTWDNGVVNGAPFVQATGTTVYIVIGTDGNGCENSDTVDVSVVAYPDISVTNDGVNLTAEPGYSYQWVDCDSIYADIPGETNQSFTPTVSGNYAVVVDNSGCVDTSSCFLFPVSTIYVEGGNEEISIYPNPSSGKFYFEFGNPYFAEQIVIFDATGRLIHLVNVNNKTRVDIDISTNSAGVYFCKIEGNGSVQVHRLIIE